MGIKKMERYSLGSTMFRNKCKQKYDFTGKLEGKSCENFVENLKISVATKQGRRKVAKEKQIKCLSVKE